MTPDLIYDQLIGMGAAERLVFSWGGNPGVGSLHRLRDAVENGWPGPLELIEHSHAAMANAYDAGAANLPFAVLRGYLGTDLPSVNDRIRTVRCPFTGEELAAVPAIRPDVAIIHAQRADAEGNVLLEGIVGAARTGDGRGARRILRATLTQCGDSAGLDRHRDQRGAAWGASLLCAWLLQARQRLLHRLGQDRARAGEFSGLDARARAEAIMSDYTGNEIMTVVAARALSSEDVCFVGIGAPSAACNLARLTHAPGITLIYESGTIATRPDVLPLSIGDGELCDTALTTVSVPEMFRYWLQGGRITVGFLGGAQIDRFANLNTTVVGPYAHPKVRLPGGGGAPEIATQCGQIFITMAQNPRAFVAKLDFITSFGHGEGGDHRRRLGIGTRGPTQLITDLAVLEPDAVSHEMVVTSMHPGVSREQLTAATGWPLRFAARVQETPAPTTQELTVLRDLQERTRRAHAA
jgi:glutaconate CoA-transferase subunit A